MSSGTITTTHQQNGYTIMISIFELYRDDIALSLEEDVYGASGEFNETQLRERLMQKIVEGCYSKIYDGTGEMSVAEHEFKPVITLCNAARMILGVWRSQVHGSDDGSTAAVRREDDCDHQQREGAEPRLKQNSPPAKNGNHMTKSFCAVQAGA
jgi:hypothetical protein